MDTIEFRNQYRKTEIGANYSGIGHLLFTTISCLTVISVCLYNTNNIQKMEWVIIPFSFLFGNFAEYFGHKGPMHHKRKYLEKVFTRHTLQHHRFFSNDVMQCDGFRDFKMILFPPVLFIFFFVMSLPLTLVFSLGYYCIPVVAFIFYVLTSMELIAEEIEDPFGKDSNDLPTDSISKNIRKHVHEIFGYHPQHH